MGERENKKRKNSCEKVSHLEGLCPLSIGTLTYPRMGNQSKRGGIGRREIFLQKKLTKESDGNDVGEIVKSFWEWGYVGEEDYWE